MIDDKLIEQITQMVIDKLPRQESGNIYHSEKPNTEKIPVGVSGRHLHISKQHLEKLFGPGYNLTKYKDLSQPGQFAANECVTVIGKKGVIQNVRILGPVRPQTQVEISITDGFTLGIKPPVFASGNLSGTPGAILQGTKGIVELTEGVICSMRHLHCTEDDAKIFNLKDKQIVSLKSSGIRSVIFNNVLVRVDKNFKLDFHLDIDEANAAGICSNDFVEMGVMGSALGDSELHF